MKIDNRHTTASGLHWPALVFLALAVVWFATLGTRRLLNPDEGRYAEIAREMLVTGDWVTPRLNGVKYFEKPPLQYWMTAAAYAVFGQNEFAARLWNGLCGLAGALFAWYAGGRLFGREAGRMAAAVLGSSVLHIVIAQLNILDMGLAFFLEVAVCSFLLAQQTAPNSAAERRWMLLAWGGAALAFLSKGLVALVLPALSLAAYTVATRDYSAWKRLHIAAGLGLFLLLAAPWVLAVSLANPEFPGFFFIHEQFTRFLTTVHDRDAPWWYFLPYLALGALPWTSLALQTARASWRAETAGFQPKRFLMVWIAVVVVFFSLSHSKLPPYIAPVTPALALLLGDALTRIQARVLQRHFLVMGSLLLALSCAVMLVPASVAGGRSVTVVHEVRAETAAAFLFAAFALLAAVRLLRRHSASTAVLTAAAGVLLALCLLLHGADALRDTRSGYDLAQRIAPHVSAETKLYSVGEYDQTLPFYLRRTLTLVAFRGELDFGLRQEPALALNDIAAFAREWIAQPHALAVMAPGIYAQLVEQGLPMKPIASSAKLIAVKKP